jgi:hypothetical protein
VAGIHVRYPAGWVYDEDAVSVFFAEDDAALDLNDPSVVPLFVFLASPPEDVSGELGTPVTPQALLDDVAFDICSDDCQLGESERWRFGDLTGVGTTLRWTDTWSGNLVDGYIAAAVGDEVAGVALGVAPADEWPLYAPVFRSMLESLTFSPPERPEAVERGPIRAGQTTRGTLAPGGVDAWTFEAREGEYATVRLDAIDADALDPYLALYDAGTLLVEDDDSGEGANALIVDFRLDADGTYYIYVSAYSGSGDYRLSLDLSDEPSGGGDVAYGETVVGILPGSGVHTWTFDGRGGDEVRIEMNAADSDGALDPYLDLYSPDDELLISDDDSGGNLNALIDYYILPQDGVYQIVASDISGNPGAYELTLKLTELRVAGSLEYGHVVTAALEEGGRHHWLFEGQQGEVVTILMNALDEELDAYLELFAPTGERLITDDDSGGGTDPAVVEFLLPASGAYRIVARGYDIEDAGGYTLQVESVELVMEGALVYGQTVVGSLEEGERQYWTFDGRNGDVITISMTAFDEELAAFLELVAPDGRQVASDDDSGGGANAEIRAVELPLTGAYRVVARGYSRMSAGKYELTLTGPR